MSSIAKRTSGRRLRAASIMSGELSMAVMTASGNRRCSNSVELPGPHPISAARTTVLLGIRARRSLTGRDRSPSNLVYWIADQVTADSIWLGDARSGRRRRVPPIAEMVGRLESAPGDDHDNARDGC